MSLLFLDTSAIIKLYLIEVGSNWLKSFIAGNQISISELALYEGATVLRRRYLEGSITQPQALALYARLQQESQSYDIIELRSERQLERVVIWPSAYRKTYGYALWIAFIWLPHKSRKKQLTAWFHPNLLFL
jgi:predicted nucleic acid-binding protein